MSGSSEKSVLVSGASFAGLSTAYWMRRLGYEVTVVETARGLRTGGTAVNIEGRTVEIAERMGILERIRSNRLNLELWEYKNADDVNTTCDRMISDLKSAQTTLEELPGTSGTTLLQQLDAMYRSYEDAVSSDIGPSVSS